MPPLITLLTDFGLADTYVGQVKGAILSVTPDAHIVDLTHSVPPQDVRAGAFLLWTAVEAFPAGSIHLAVIDPGVGSERLALGLRSRRGDLLLGPDNGLLPWAADRLGGIMEQVELDDAAYWRASPLSTFHGRDVFGPVAGHLAAGIPLARVGSPLPGVLRLGPFPQAVRQGSTLIGHVLHVDTYGNLVTSVPGDALPNRFGVRVGAHVIRGAPHPHFQAVPPGALLAVIGSSGLLEVAVRDGSATALTGAVRGNRVVVERD